MTNQAQTGSVLTPAKSTEDLVILRKVSIFAVFKWWRLLGVGDTAVLACCAGTCSNPSTCSPVIRRLSKSTLHRIVKIHETSFRGCQIRGLSIAPRGIPPQQAFSSLIAQRHYSGFIIVLVIRHLSQCIPSLTITHYSCLYCPPNNRLRMRNCYGGSFLFSSRRIQYLLGDISQILLGYLGIVGEAATDSSNIQK